MSAINILSLASAIIISTNINNCARFKHKRTRDSGEKYLSTTAHKSDAKNLLFDCLLHQLGCCYARSLEALSLRSNKSELVINPSLVLALRLQPEKGNTF